MSDLDDFVSDADRKSAFIKFVDGEPTTLTYVDAELIEDKFTPGQKTVQYTVEVDGIAKTFNSKSANLARQIAKIEPGTDVVITKEGEGFKTRWFVKKVSKKSSE